jgi:hypothetical protein
LDQATRSILQFGLLGLALAAGLVGALQTRPTVVLPFYGTFSVQVANPHAQFAPASDGCHYCNVTSFNMTIDSVTVHREGELNLTGGWLKISTASSTIDTAQIAGIGQLVGQAPLPPGNINLIRLNVSSASAEGLGTGRVPVSIPGGKIDVVLNPSGQVRSGKSTSVFLAFQLSVDCGGNGECRLKPVLVSRIFGPG